MGKANNKHPKSAKHWFEMAKAENEEIEEKRQEFVRNVAQRNTGISSDREKFPDGAETFSHKILPPNTHDED